MFAPTKRKDRERSLWSFDPTAFFRGVFDDEGMLPYTAPEDGMGMLPRCDIHEEGGVYVVDAELPGMKENEIEIRAHGHELEIEGERRTETRDEKKVRRREIRTGRFYRRIQFAEEIDPDHTEATFEDGILTVRLAHTEDRSRVRIPIGRKHA